MWDRWLEQLTQASGGQMPTFANQGGLRKLPTSPSLDALQQLNMEQGWGNWKSLEEPRKKLENY